MISERERDVVLATMELVPEEGVLAMGGDEMSVGDSASLLCLLPF